MNLLKNSYFQQENKSIFLGSYYKIFCLWCTFLQELTIHDHERFGIPLKFWKFPYSCLFMLSLPVCKKSNLLFRITLDISDHINLKWLNINVSLLLFSYHMKKSNLITQFILEIKLTCFLLSIWACSGVPEHTNLNLPTNI